MHVAIQKMGKSQGVLIPKLILLQVGIEGTADLQVKNGVIEIRPVKRNLREGWDKDSQAIALANDDQLVWPAFANKGDAGLVW